ncbi:Uncharacterized protein OBRU01_11960 [Operophtera brumata]|uniref:Uncharacterized protein n=1 Tax=Operophtera brumata TaxID=104452 RepID=A0A0L7LBN5_OPEBR|nr:Uncharacterized protein OBRU01_11960 [Operophtera brumata]
MKLTAKFSVSSHRREQSQTGGGEKPPSPSPEDLAIMAVAPHDFVIEVDDFDSDAVIPVSTTPKESIVGPSVGTEDMRQSITKSNIDFKKRQIEMLEVEHLNNVKIAELKIIKLELQIALLQHKKNTITEEYNENA